MPEEIKKYFYRIRCGSLLIKDKRIDEEEDVWEDAYGKSD